MPGRPDSAQLAASRYQLREHPSVLQALKAYWSLFHTDDDGNLTKKEYIGVHIRIAKALCGPNIDRGKAHEGAVMDWEMDHKDSTMEGLTRDEYFDALFEVADIWSDDKDDYQSYVIFLKKLFIRITEPITDQVICPT